MKLEKFIENLDEQFDTTPTNQNPAENARITSPTMSKRSYVYGTGGNRKGSFRSTAQSRKENLQNVNAENIVPAMKDAFDYIVAMSGEVSSNFASQMRSRLNQVLQVAKRLAEQEAKKQSK
jgi:hypothetical protein